MWALDLPACILAIGKEICTRGHSLTLALHVAIGERRLSCLEEKSLCQAYAQVSGTCPGAQMPATSRLVYPVPQLNAGNIQARKRCVEQEREKNDSCPPQTVTKPYTHLAP
jgi:hypothetical protein